MNQPYQRRRFGDVLARRDEVLQRAPSTAAPLPEPAVILELAPVGEPDVADRTAQVAVDDIPPPPDEAARPSTPAVYHGALRLHGRGDSSRTGMTVKLEMLDLAFTDVNPFKGMPVGKQGGTRCRVWIARQEDVDAQHDMADVVPVYKGETILLTHQDDPNGTTATFLLDDGPDGVGLINPFKSLFAAPKDGERLHGAFWALSEQETLQHPAHVRRRKTPFHQKPPTQQAQMLCRNPRFISFLKENEAFYLDGGFSEVDVHEDGPGFAADVVRKFLRVTSRADLKDEGVAGDRARMRWERMMVDFELDKYGAWERG